MENLLSITAGRTSSGAHGSSTFRSFNPGTSPGGGAVTPTSLRRRVVDNPT